MFALPVIGTRKARLQGERTHRDLCECCGVEFEATVRRKVVGEDTSLFSWTSRHAYAKATHNAEKMLKERLEKELDASPCPECGWVQQAMIQSVRERSYIGFRTISTLALLFTLGIVLPLSLALMLNEEYSFKSIIIATAIILQGLAIGVSARLCRYGLNTLYNPNRHHPNSR